MTRKLTVAAIQTSYGTDLQANIDSPEASEIKKYAGPIKASGATLDLNGLHVYARVARGYRVRSELTAEKFVPEPWSGAAGNRAYRTGDLARWRPDGVLEYEPTSRGAGAYADLAQELIRRGLLRSRPGPSPGPGRVRSSYSGSAAPAVAKSITSRSSSRSHTWLLPCRSPCTSTGGPGEASTASAQSHQRMMIRR